MTPSHIIGFHTRHFGTKLTPRDPEPKTKNNSEKSNTAPREKVQIQAAQRAERARRRSTHGGGLKAGGGSTKSACRGSGSRERTKLSRGRGGSVYSSSSEGWKRSAGAAHAAAAADAYTSGQRGESPPPPPPSSPIYRGRLENALFSAVPPPLSSLPHDDEPLVCRCCSCCCCTSPCMHARSHARVLIMHRPPSCVFLYTLSFSFPCESACFSRGWVCDENERVWTKIG